MSSRVVVVGALAVAVVAAAVVGVAVWRSAGASSEFARAVALAPVGTERVGWTDWAGLRGDTPAASADDMSAFLDDAYRRDLTSASALGTSAETLRAELGLSPANLDWEVFAQSPDGAALLLRPPDSFDFDAFGDRLERLGFARPDDDDGTWRGGPDVVARIGALTPQVQYWVLLPDEGLVLASDAAGYADTAAAAARGDGERVAGLDEAVDAAGEPRSAVVYAAAYVCEALAMAQADGPDQDEADQLVREAGTVSPLTGYAMAAQPDGTVDVVLTFENEEQARANADSRAVLAAGPAPGQGGAFSDRFEVVSSTAEDRTVVLALDPVEGRYVVSDLSSGPVLFATC